MKNSTNPYTEKRIAVSNAEALWFRFQEESVRLEDFLRARIEEVGAGDSANYDSAHNRVSEALIEIATIREYVCSRAENHPELLIKTSAYYDREDQPF